MIFSERGTASIKKNIFLVQDSEIANGIPKFTLYQINKCKLINNYKQRNLCVNHFNFLRN